MKFKFSLEKVLKYRHTQVDLARRDFLQAQSKLDQAISVRDQMIIDKETTLQNRSQVIQKENNWQLEVEQMNAFLSGQDLRIARQNEGLKLIEKEVESYREILMKALSEAKMIERLKEKKKEEFIKNFNEKEQKELDEIATARYVRTEEE